MMSSRQPQNARTVGGWIAKWLCIFGFWMGFPLHVEAGPCAVGETAVAGITGNPKLWMEEPQVELLPGTPFELRFHVGTPREPVRSLFGISFELRYSSDQYLEFAQPTEIFKGDFLLPDVYTFIRHEQDRKVISLAVSRKRGASGQSGDGVILRLPLKLAKDAPEGWQVCFQVTNITANDSVGNRIEIDAGPILCLKVVTKAVEVTPNPFTPNGDGFNDRVRFKRDGGIPPDWVILIMDRSGRIIRRLTDGRDVWDGRDENGRPMLPGAYLYSIRKGDRIIRRGLVGLIR